MASPARHRFAFIDGLRGIAATGVATLHVAHLLFKSPAGAAFSETAREIVDWGRYGVSVMHRVLEAPVTRLARSLFTLPSSRSTPDAQAQAA